MRNTLKKRFCSLCAAVMLTTCIPANLASGADEIPEENSTVLAAQQETGTERGEQPETNAGSEAENAEKQPGILLSTEEAAKQPDANAVSAELTSEQKNGSEASQENAEKSEAGESPEAISPEEMTQPGNREEQTGDTPAQNAEAAPGEEPVGTDAGNPPENVPEENGEGMPAEPENGGSSEEENDGSDDNPMNTEGTDEKPDAPADTSEPEEKAEPEEKTESEEKTEPAENVEPADKTEPEEKTEPAENVEPVEKTEPEEKTEPAENVEPAEKTEPEEKTEPAENVEPAEKTEPEEVTESAEKTEAKEKTEPAETTEQEEKVEPAEKTEPEEKTETEEKTEAEEETETEDPEEQDSEPEVILLGTQDVVVSYDLDVSAAAALIASPDAGKSGPKLMKLRSFRAAAPTLSRTEYVGLDIAPADMDSLPENALYHVDITLGRPIDMLAGEEDARISNSTVSLYHVVDGAPVRVEADFSRSEDGRRITGISFDTDGFSPYIVAYTVEFYYEDRAYSLEVRGAEDIALSGILGKLGILGEGESIADKMESAETSNPEIFRLTEAENDWTLRVLKESGHPETLTVTERNGRKHVITLTANGITEVSTGDGKTVIHTVNDWYLPEDAAARNEEITGERNEDVIRAVQEAGAELNDESGYQVFSVGLDGADPSDYEGFTVDVELEKPLEGKGFRLYQVKDGRAEDITDTLKLEGEEYASGRRDLTKYSFTADELTDYVLSYSLITYYTAFDGATFRIALNYGPEAGIPEGAELKVREVLPDADEYEELLNLASESDNETNPAESGGYARFFDIEIRKDSQAIEPKANVSVTINLEDLPELSSGMLRVVHFDKQNGLVLMGAEISADDAICFEAESFSVYGVIVDSLPAAASNLEGKKCQISKSGYYITNQSLEGSPTKLGQTDDRNGAATWEFESAGSDGAYYLFTWVNWQKKYLKMTKADSGAHATLTDQVDRTEFNIAYDNNNYLISTRIDGQDYYLIKWEGDSGTGFAGFTSGALHDAKMTFTFDQYSPGADDRYAVIIKDPSSNKYYAVQNDGRLAEVEYIVETNTAKVKLDYPLLWTYTFAYDGLSDDTKSYNGSEAHPDQEPHNLRIVADARGYNAGTQLAEGSYYRYISPAADSGIAQEDKNNPSHNAAKIANGLRYDNHKLFNSEGKYIGADFSSMHITGNKTADQAATVYLAKVDASSVPSYSSNNETVSHIDIAIVGEGILDVPLAYGTYYDASGTPVLEVSSGSDVTLHLTKEVDINKEDIMKASVRAFDKNGEELTDAFYITGYSANQQTDHSAVQVRMEGSFKVDTLAPYPNGLGRSNQDGERKAARLENQVYYRVSAVKDVTFEMVYNGQQLYDRNGKPLTVTTKVSMTAGFSYWDPGNECPPLQDDFEEKYPFLYGAHPDQKPGTNHNDWKSGAIIDNSWSSDYFRPGDSGMDFILGNKEDSQEKILAVEIVKIVENEVGERIHPADDLTNKFAVSYNPNGDPDSVKDYAVSPNAVESSSINYSGYYSYRNHEVAVGRGGIGVLYDYDARPGMYYVTEDSAAMSGNGANVIITDTDGKKWKYKETRIETEYVWRTNGDDGKRHAAMGYSSVPEVLGAYKDSAGGDLNNGFLEFYAHNIYTCLGSLKITKTVKLNGQDLLNLPDENGWKKLADGTYTFNIFSDNTAQTPAKKADGTDIGDVTVTIENGSMVKAAEVTDLMPGIYYVKEVSSDNDGVTIDTAVYPVEVKEGNTGDEVDADGTAAAINTLKTGSLKINKEIKNSSGEDISATPSYPIRISVQIGESTYYVQDKEGTLGVSAPADPLKVTAGTELVVSNLPIMNQTASLNYKVEEINPGNVTITDYSGISSAETVDTVTNINITTDTAGQANLKNIYERDTGSLSIRKTVTVNGKTVPNTKLVDGVYTFTISSHAGVDPKTENQEVSITISNGKITAASGTNVRMDNDRAIVSKLPTGTYTVLEVLNQEQNDKGITFTAENNTDVVVTKDNDASIPTASFVNNIKVGSLKITKEARVGTELASDLNDARKNLVDGVYTFNLYRKDNTPATKADGTAVGDIQIEINNGKAASVEVTDLLPGEYYVKEASGTNGLIPINTETTYPVVVTADKTGDSIEENGIAKVTNTLPVNQLVITKVIKSTTPGDTIETKPSYPIVVSVILNGDTYYVQNTNGELGTAVPSPSLSVTAGQPLTINNLPYGSHTVVESNPGSIEIEDYSYCNTADSRSSGSASVGETSGKVDLVNVYVKHASWTPQVIKQLNGILYNGTSFEFTISEGNQVLNTINTVTSGVVSFAKINYDQAGTHDYVIRENKGTDTYIMYDTAPIYARVVVSNNNNVLEAVGKYYSDKACTQELNTPTFQNYETGTLEVSKTVTGAFTPNADTVYPITVKHGSRYVSAKLDETTGVYHFKEFADTSVPYYIPANGSIKFDGLPVGEYMVAEEEQSIAGYTILTTYNPSNGKASVGKADRSVIGITNHYRKAELTITKKIEGQEVNPSDVAPGIAITVMDDNGNLLLDKAPITGSGSLFTGPDDNKTYTAVLRSTDSGDYAKYIVPDGKYTVTEYVTVPNGYVLTGSVYAVTAEETIDTKPAANGNGYTLQLTNTDTSTGTISFTNTYEKPEPPHKKETDPYEGIDILGGVQVGDTITYEISYKNYKNTPATVKIKDTLDPNVKYVSSSNAGIHSGEEAGGTVTWTVAGVAVGDTGKVTLTVKVLEGALQSKGGEGKVVNGGEGATVKVGDDNEFTLETVENPVPEVPHKRETRVTRDGTELTGDYTGNGTLGGVQVGDVITYEISYKNYKTEKADVIIKDTLDKNVRFVEADNAGKHDGAEQGGIVTWTLKEVEAGKEGKVTLQVKVLEGALQSKGGAGKVVNGGEGATVKVGNDNEFTLETVENPVPEEPRKQETGATRNGTALIGDYSGNGTLGGVQVGDVITYEISYKNYKSKAADIVIKDKLDTHVSFAEASDGGANSSGTVTWTLKDVPAGKEGTVTLKVTVLESALESSGGPGKVVNDGDTATVKVGNDSEYTLQTVENPVPEVPHKQETGVTRDGTDLTGDYTGNGTLGGVQVGDVITYEISYKNYKTEKADVIIKDTLDKNVSFVEADNAGKHDGAEQGGIVTWTLKEVEAGKEGKVTLQVEVLEGALQSKGGAGKVVNGGEGATVKVGNDNEFTLETVENPVPEEPRKQETGATRNGTALIGDYSGNGTLGGVQVGDIITYEISYRNYKTEAADIVIKDKLDTHVSFAEASDGGTKSYGTVVWTLKAVPAGKEGTVTLKVTVLESALESSGGPGKVVNGGDTATVKVGNDSEYTLQTVENPVPEVPHKQETGVTRDGTDLTGDYTGNGILGGVQVGDVITYEISYKNYKAEAADVVIKDKLDTHVSFTEASDGGVNSNGTVTWTLKAVPAGKEGTVTLKVTVLESAMVSSGGPGKVVNGGDTATVKVGNDHEYTLETVENPVPEAPHKQEVKPYEGNGVLGAVKVGDVITYEISYKNYKAEKADVVIKDKLDIHVAFKETSDGGKNKDGVVTWTLKNVPAGKEGTVKLKVTVLESALVSGGGPGKVVNGGDTATVKVGNDHEYTLETVENPVPEKPHKQETGAARDGSALSGNYTGNGTLGGVKVGDVITYEISYRNYKSEAADIVIRDKLDTHVAFAEASDGGANSSGTVIWTLKNVPAGKEGTVTLKVTVLESALKSGGGPGKVVNDGDTATVQVGNDSEYTLDTVENPVPEVPHKQETGATHNGTALSGNYTGNGTLGGVQVGDVITYEISYRNYKAEAADIVIRDKLDTHVAFAEASKGGANSNGTVTWTLKNVPAGKEGKVTLKVTVLESALKSKGGPGKVVNDGDTATVKVGNDHEFTLDTVENPVPEVPHKQEVKPYEGNGVLGAVKVGEVITYEISYRNYKSEAADIVIKDKLDKNVSFAEASDGGANSSGTVTWTLKAVPAGKEGKVTLKVTVLESALKSKRGPGKVVNDGDTATVKVGNDSEYTLDTVENPVPEVPHKQEVQPYAGNGVLGAVKVGDEITYEISYRNYKTAAADIIIKDQLDPHVDFVSAGNGGTESNGTVTWTLKAVPAGREGKVTLTVKVLESALKSSDGPGKVVNGGDTATVKVGNDREFTLDTVENPVPDEPRKREVMPYRGSGILGAVEAGEEITYEISYRNYKDETADITIMDWLDRNVSFVEASNGGTHRNRTVTWKLKAVPAGEEGKVTLKVKVLESALKENNGPGKVVNGGETSTVQVGSDPVYFLNTVENPVVAVLTVSVTVKKVWDDGDNFAGIRPASVRVTLSTGESYTLNAENNWTVTVEDLPGRNEKGERIEYTWTEHHVKGYRRSVAVEEDVTTFTNIFRIPPSMMPPEGGRPRLTILEDYETPLGIDAIINHVGDCYE